MWDKSKIKHFDMACNRRNVPTRKKPPTRKAVMKEKKNETDNEMQLAGKNNTDSTHDSDYSSLFTDGPCNVATNDVSSNMH